MLPQLERNKSHSPRVEGEAGRFMRRRFHTGRNLPMLGSRLLCGAALVLVSAAAVGSAAANSFTTFDPKGSIYTLATGINTAGAVAGYYMDSNYATHGFLRAPDGTITTIDPKGSNLTEVTAVNDTGDVAGFYRNASGIYYSFVLAADGTFTKFNPTNGTQPNMIGLNADGMVAGSYIKNGDQGAGFVGMPNGQIKQLGVEGVAVNTKGTVTGTDGAQGFVRLSTGKMVTFTAPGSPNTTIPTSINDSGVVGGYGNTVCGRSSGFSRNSNGTMTTIEPPGGAFAQVMGVNGKGAMTGNYYYNGYRGFVRTANGAYRTFDVAGSSYGTFPQSINANGEVTGSYRDSNDVQHGFVGTP